MCVPGLSSATTDPASDPVVASSDESGLMWEPDWRYGTPSMAMRVPRKSKLPLSEGRPKKSPPGRCALFATTLIAYEMYNVSSLSILMVRLVSSTFDHKFETWIVASVIGCALQTRALEPNGDEIEQVSNCPFRQICQMSARKDHLGRSDITCHRHRSRPCQRWERPEKCKKPFDRHHSLTPPCPSR